jgi:hypothetical protein
MGAGLARSVIVKHMDASWFKRFIYRLCMPIGYQMADFHFEKQNPPRLAGKSCTPSAYRSCSGRSRTGWASAASAAPPPAARPWGRTCSVFSMPAA